MERMLKFFQSRPWFKNGKCLVCFKTGDHTPTCPVRGWEAVVTAATVEAAKAAKTGDRPAADGSVQAAGASGLGVV